MFDCWNSRFKHGALQLPFILKMKGSPFNLPLRGLELFASWIKLECGLNIFSFRDPNMNRNTKCLVKVIYCIKETKNINFIRLPLVVPLFVPENILTYPYCTYFFFYFCLLLRQHLLRYFPAFDLYEHNHFHSYRLFILILVSAFDLYEVIISEFGHCIMALSWDYFGCKNPLPHGAPTSYIFIFH